MKFELSDDQEAIKRAARDFLAGRLDLRAVRRALDGDGDLADLWGEIRKLGWTGIAVPSELGGQGLGVMELVLVCEELGYGAAPIPFVSHAAAEMVIAYGAGDEQRARLLPALASGERRAAIAFGDGDGGELAIDGEGAETLVVVRGDKALVVDAAEARLDAVPGIDPGRQVARLEFNGGEELTGDVCAGLDRAELALSGELVGVAQRALEMGTEYAKTRVQFNRPIGSYQAVSHRLAQMLLDTESARSAVYYAAWVADSQPEDLALASSVAKVAAADAGWAVSASSLQVHGGIGFTWEHDLQFFLKRASSSSRVLGSTSWHRERIATLGGLGDRT